MSYTWNDWYKNVCEKQQNLNMNLTSDLAEAGRIREENEFKLNRIVGRFPFRMIYGGKGVPAVDNVPVADGAEGQDGSGNNVEAGRQDTDVADAASVANDIGLASKSAVPESSESVSVMILSSGRPEYLKVCIENLITRTKHKAIEPVIIDGSKSPDDKQNITRLLASFTENHGLRFDHVNVADKKLFSDGIRAGAEVTKSEYILIITDGVSVIEECWLDHMLAAFDDGVSAVAAVSWAEDFCFKAEGNRETSEEDVRTAACMLVKRGLLAALELPKETADAGDIYAAICNAAVKGGHKCISCGGAALLKFNDSSNVYYDAISELHFDKESIGSIGFSDSNYSDNCPSSSDASVGTVSDNNTSNDEITDYIALYLSEKQRTEKLKIRIEQERAAAEAAGKRLAEIKSTGIWKLSGPARSFYHFLQRTKDRVARYGSIRGIARKLSSKSIEKKARLQHGTASFPNAEERKRQEETVFPEGIKISILVPLYNTPKNFLCEMIDSVKAQTYGGWELCLADGSDDAHSFVGDICREYAKDDKRIVYKKLEKNEGISGNTNECLKMATGSYIGLFDHDDVLHPSVLYEYMKRICEEHADYIYCDETTFKGNKTIDHMLTLHFKPDFAPDNLRANNYICHFSVFKRTLLDGTELFRTQFDGSQDHDMILRLTSRAKKVVHVPKILYYWRSHAGSVAADINAKSYAIDAAKGAVADHLTRNGYKNFEITSTKAFETIFRIKYEIRSIPKVSIVIPNKDHVSDLKRLLDSILNKSTYENYEIIIVENNSTDQATFAYYDEVCAASDKVRYVRYSGDFNFSKICNYGAQFVTGEFILLLNNDMEVITVNWLEELLMYAQRDDVGAVGAKLYYPDHTIQHAGVVIGLGAHRTAGHVHYRCADTNLGYMGRLCYAQNFSAVTGACLMVSKKKYDELGGLDESFAVALNDVDFCLRLLEKGYVNIWTPFCELYHFESASRGSDVEKPDPEKAKRYDEESEHFRTKWKALLEKGDPYYNVNFSLDRSDFTLKV